MSLKGNLPNVFILQFSERFKVEHKPDTPLMLDGMGYSFLVSVNSKANYTPCCLRFN